jgi:hypothetical protein
LLFLIADLFVAPYCQPTLYFFLKKSTAKFSQILCAKNNPQ